MDCHHKTQIRGGFGRKLDAKQIILYRDDWHKIVAQKRNIAQGTLQDVAVQILKWLDSVSEQSIDIHERKTIYPDYDLGLIGRETELEILKSFFQNPVQHFFLLYGKGGMGKTHLVSKILQETDCNFIYKECDKDFTLDKLFRTCSIKNPIELKYSKDKCQFFIEQFRKENLWVVLDDFYEVLDEEVRSLIPEMIHISNGKLLVISRAIPYELAGIDYSFLNHRLEPLGRKAYFEVLNNYAFRKNKNLSLSDTDKEKIYQKTLGYPIAGHFVIRLLALREDLDDILKNLVKFDAEVDPEGKEFSGRLLNVIFEKGNKKETDLFCQFAAFTEPIGLNAVKQLPGYDLQVLENLIRKDLIWLEENNRLNTIH